MGPGDVVKRVPKWAWIASGGVVVGSVALRALKRTPGGGDAATTTEAADAGSAVDPYGVGYNGNAAIVVPPVTNVSTGEADYTGALAQQFLTGTQSTLDTLLALPGMITGAVQTGGGLTLDGVYAGAGIANNSFASSLAVQQQNQSFQLAQQQQTQADNAANLASLGTLWNPTNGQTSAWSPAELAAAAAEAATNAVGAWMPQLMTGGGAPANNGSQGQVTAPPPAAPNVVIPVATQQTAQPTTGGSVIRPADRCVGKYPFLNETTGKCYRLVIYEKGGVKYPNGARWHFYAPDDSHKVRVA